MCVCVCVCWVCVYVLCVCVCVCVFAYSSVYVCFMQIHQYHPCTSIDASTRDRPQAAPFSKIGTDAAAVPVVATCFKVTNGLVIGLMYFWHF